MVVLNPRWNLRGSVFLSLLLLSCSQASAEIVFDVVDLGLLPGGTTAYPTGIDNSGQAVGYASSGWGTRAFRYDSAGMHDLTSQLGNVTSLATAAAGGKITGYYYSSGSERAFLIDGATTFDLGTIDPAASGSIGLGINENGWVVGEVEYSATGDRGFFYNGTTATVLGTLRSDGTGMSTAQDINANNRIAGYASADGGDRAFIYDTQTGVMTDLHSLGTRSRAFAINDDDHVVGHFYTSGGATAFVHDGTAMSNLGTLGGNFSSARDINSIGQIVGYSSIFSGGPNHAFLFESGVMKDLNTLIDPALDITLDGAYGINDSGQIVASGTYSNSSSTRGFLLTATSVPEPGSLGLGLIAVITAVVRKGLSGMPFRRSNRSGS